MPPQLLEDALRLAAGVDEDQRGLVRLISVVDLAERMARRMPGPRQLLGGIEHGDVGLRRRPAPTTRSASASPPAAAAPDNGADRRARRPSPRARRVVSPGASANSRARPSDKQIAALRGDERMQLVEHDAPERAEQIRRVGRGEQQRQLLRRGQQDVGRIAALALALRCGRVAGAGLDADRQAHLGDRRFEVARDVDGERLERRDVERVQAALAAACRGRWR